jgi:hypothetical protein
LLRSRPLRVAPRNKEISPSHFDEENREKLGERLERRLFVGPLGKWRYHDTRRGSGGRNLSLCKSERKRRGQVPLFDESVIAKLHRQMARHIDGACRREEGGKLGDRRRPESHFFFCPYEPSEQGRLGVPLEIKE